MNNAIQVLFDEHNMIKSVIGAAENIPALIGVNDAQYEKTVRQLLDFFRNYADKYHHHKEELILFPEMNKKNELLEAGVIAEMLENHADFRQMLKSVEDFLDKKDYRHVHQQLQLYFEALLDHIAVEDDEVFQVAESLFSENELENIFFRFQDCDRELGDSEKNEFLKTAAAIRQELLQVK